MNIVMEPVQKIFIQVSNTKGDIVALDNYGQVWILDDVHRGEWRQLPAHPEG